MVNIVDLNKTPIRHIQGQMTPEGNLVLEIDFGHSGLSLVGTKERFLPIMSAFAKMPQVQVIKPGGDEGPKKPSPHPPKRNYPH